MASTDLTASTPVLIDANNPVLIKSTIDAMQLALATDTLFVIPLTTQNKVMILKVERTA